MNRRLIMLVAAFAAVASAHHATAALILYEGFAGYTPATNIVGQAVSASTIGLDTATTWQSNNAIVWNVESTGLSIGSGATTLQTSGGALTHKAGSSVAAAKLLLNSYAGTLYTSHLLSLNLSAANANGNVQVVVGETTQNTANRRFRSLPRSGTVAASVAGVNYTDGTTAGTGNINVSQTTFIIISRFTRVGETVDATTPGEATLFALTSGQFDNFKASGFGGIDAAVVGAGAGDVTAKAVQSYAPAAGDLRALNDTFYLQLACAISTAADATYDEVRFGDSFDAVTPVPEPSAVALAGCAVLGLGLVWRRSGPM